MADLVLRDECTEESVTAMVEELGWQPLADVTDQDGVARSLVCRVTGEVLFEYLVEDRYRCAVAVIRGQPERTVHEVTEFVAEILLPFTRKELIAAVDAAASQEELAVALVRLGLGAPRDFCHRGMYKRIKAALLDVSAPREVRLAGVRAAGYTRWPKLVKHLERVAGEDMSGAEADVVRLHAQVVLTTLGRR